MNVAYNTDCLAAMREMEDECIDLTVTSPPYDNLRDYNGYSFDWHETIKELYRITADGGVVVWVVGDATIKGSETGTSFRQALWFMDCGFNLHDTMIWEKMCPNSNKNRYISSFEYMFIFCRGNPKTANIICDRKNKHAGQKVSGSVRDTGSGRLRELSGVKSQRKVKEYGSRTNIWKISAEKNNKTGHPAVFPLQLAHDHIISWSNEGDTVLDPFLGSGTTRIAAYDLNRQFIGYEISEEYFRLQEERFNRHAAQMNLFLEGDNT